MISKGCLVRSAQSVPYRNDKVFLTISDPYEDEHGDLVIELHHPSKWGNARIHYVSTLEVISGG